MTTGFGVKPLLIEFEYLCDHLKDHFTSDTRNIIAWINSNDTNKMKCPDCGLFLHITYIQVDIKND